MSLIVLTMPENITLKTDAEFDYSIWKSFKEEAVEISNAVVSLPPAAELISEFDVVPVTEATRHVIGGVDALIEPEFPRHGAAAHFLLSTLPIPGLYDPILKRHSFHNCIQYWAFIDRKSQKCVATHGFFLTHEDHHESLWAGWMVLSPNFRNKGLGKGLVAFGAAFARVFASRHGQKFVRFSTSDEPHVKTARMIYTAFGGKEKEVFPNPYVPGHNVIVVEWEIFKQTNAVFGV